MSVLAVGAIALGNLELTHAADANPPERMTYQGYLVDGNGDPLGNSAPTNYDIIFRIYDTKQGAGKLWTEQQTVTVANGYFSVLLGEGTSFNNEPNGNLSSVFDGLAISDRFIGITVNMDGSSLEIAPRLRLLSSPYSFTATQARKLTDGAGNSNFYKEGNDLKIGAGPSPSITLTDDGYLGLGVDNPDYKLAVETTDSSRPYPLYLKGPHGILFMGAGDSSDFDFNTDLPSFYFNKPISTAGSVKAWTSGRPGVMLGGQYSSGLVDNIVEGLDANGNPGALFLNYYSDSPVYVGHGGGGLQTPYVNVTGITQSHFSGPVKVWRSGRAGISLGGGKESNYWVDNVIEGIASDGSYGSINLNWYSSGPVHLGNGGGYTYIYNRAHVVAKSNEHARLVLDASASAGREAELHLVGNYGGISDQWSIFIPGNDNDLYFYNSHGGRTHKFDYTGGAFKKGGGSWSSLSDMRLKENIDSLDPDSALEKILKLRGVTYDWVNPDEHKGGVTSGFLAQDVQSVFPHWVSDTKAQGKDKDLLKGEMSLAVGFKADFNAYMVESLRALNNKNETLVDENKTLNDKVTTLEERLAKLEAMMAEMAKKKG